MRIKFTNVILMLTLIVLLVLPTKSEEKEDRPLKNFAKLSLTKSAAALPFASLTKQTENGFIDEYNMFTGSFGIQTGFSFKIKRKYYFEMNLEYNFLSVNDKFKPMNNKDLSASYAAISFVWTKFIEEPDEFTPFFGFGFGLTLPTSNQDEIIWTEDLESDYSTEKKGEIFGEFSILFSVKSGLNIPIDEQYSIVPELDLNLVIHEYIGFMPRVQVGVIRWL